MLGMLFVLIAATLSSAHEPARLELAAVAHTPDGVGVEIPAIDTVNGLIWLTRSGEPAVARLTIDPEGAPGWLPTTDLSGFGAEATSVSVHRGLAAVSLLPDPTKGGPGTLVLLNSTGEVLDTAPVGHHPDMVTFTPDGRSLLVANEGEPWGNIDPPGSVSVVHLVRDGGSTCLSQPHTVQLAGDPAERDDLQNWFTPISRAHPHSIEPEYIACSPDGSTAYVTCQENNGIAIIDLEAHPPALRALVDLGAVDHSSPQHAIDLTRDGISSLAAAPFRSLRQPDAIAAVEVEGTLRILTADEGDPRDRFGIGGVDAFEGIDIVSPSGPNGRPTLFGSRGVTLWNAEAEPLHTVSSLLEHSLGTDKAGHISDPGRVLGTRSDRRAHKRGAEPEGLAAWSDGTRAYAVVTFERAGAAMLLAIQSDRVEPLHTLVLDGPPGSDRVPSPEGVASALLTPGDPTSRLIVIADEKTGTVTLLDFLPDRSAAKSTEPVDVHP